MVEARGKKKGRDARRARQSEEAFKRHNLKEELAEAWRKCNRKIPFGPAISKINLMESLILAQNERWRRG